jgi:hypothetical protein
MMMGNDVARMKEKDTNTKTTEPGLLPVSWTPA